MIFGAALTNGTDYWLPIPKNATTAHRQTFESAGWWKTYLGETTTHAEVYVPFRDPIDRWHSGATQYAARHGSTVESLLEAVLDGDWPVFDKHTIPQSEFLLSTFPNRRLVRLPDCVSYMRQRYGYTLPALNQRPHQTDRRLIAVLTDFYHADVELYHDI